MKSDRIANPELQRPFDWDSVKVRDLMDSLYKGYPVGYLITWQSVGAKFKGGQVAAHQQSLVDGQQRISALRAAVAGLTVINKRYKSVWITIAFNPITEEFATLTPVIRKNPQWIADISEYFSSESPLSFAREYLERNPDAHARIFETNLAHLGRIQNGQIGIIGLADDLDVETVSEIFIRINSKGVPLSSADFAMSKIATYGDRGRNLRKLIDYFCHLAVAPSHAIISPPLARNQRSILTSSPRSRSWSDSRRTSRRIAGSTITRQYAATRAREAAGARSAVAIRPIAARYGTMDAASNATADSAITPASNNNPSAR